MESKSVLRRGCQPGKRKICASVVVFAVVIGCVLLAHTAFGTKPKNDALKKVFVIFRHGDRNPTETYPNDPYRDIHWPGGWGALTKKGMQQLYKLGQWVRDEYGWLTDNKYVSSTTMVNSSYADRCIESMQAFLAGLYPLEKDEIFAPGLFWRPIAVHYLPRHLDQILVVNKSCPMLQEALAEAYHNESLRSDDELKPYYKELSRLTGKEIKTITDVEFLYNTLEIEVMRNLKLPSEIAKFFYDKKMRELAARSYALFTSNDLQRRLRGGPLLKDILEHMRDDVKHKMYFYATHDVSLVNTLRAMGFVDELFKLDIGVTLIYELLVVNGGQSQEVRVSMLNNTDQTEPHRLKIPGCQDPCLLTDLFNVWGDVLPVDWDQECQL